VLVAVEFDVAVEVMPEKIQPAGLPGIERRDEPSEQVRDQLLATERERRGDARDRA
jgi:hypothetical protein